MGVVVITAAVAAVLQAHVGTHRPGAVASAEHLGLSDYHVFVAKSRPRVKCPANQAWASEAY
jgi:hypothetical protein